MTPKTLHRDHGFSFIELLAYMAIAALLILAAIPQFGAYRAKAGLATLQSDLHNVALSMEAEWNADDGYPRNVPASARVTAGNTIAITGLAADAVDLAAFVTACEASGYYRCAYTTTPGVRGDYGVTGAQASIVLPAGSLLWVRKDTPTQSAFVSPGGTFSAGNYEFRQQILDAIGLPNGFRLPNGIAQIGHDGADFCISGTTKLAPSTPWSYDTLSGGLRAGTC